jgi:transposase
VLKQGCTWRALSHDYLKWENGYYHFCKWTDREGRCDDRGLRRQAGRSAEGSCGRGGDTGEKFAEKVKELLGAEVEIAKRSELHTFAVIPKRRGVERSFGWLEKCHRLWRNCECKLQTE